MEYQKHTWTTYSVDTYALITQTTTAMYYVVIVVADCTGLKPKIATMLVDGTEPYDGTNLIVHLGMGHVMAQILYWDTQNIWLPGTGQMFSSS